MKGEIIPGRDIVYQTGSNSRQNLGLIGSSLAAERGKSRFFVAALFPRLFNEKVSSSPLETGEKERVRGRGTREERLWATLVSSNNYSPETTNPRIQDQRFRLSAAAAVMSC